MKTTKEEIKKMKQMKKEGLSYIKIGKEFNLSAAGVRYHFLSKEEKEKKLNETRNWFMKKPFKERQKIYAKRRPYFQKWYKNLKEGKR